VLAAALAAGCGGAASKPAAGDAVVPAKTTVFLSVDTDASSAQFRAAMALLARFPAATRLVSAALGRGVDPASLAAAVGPEADVAVLSSPSERHAAAVVLVRPTDAAKLDSLLAKSGKPYVKADVDGWTAIARTQAALDRFEAARSSGSLADSSAYQDVMAGLPSQPLARFFVNGSAVQTSGFGSLAGSTVAAGGTLTAEANGLRFEGFSRTADLATGQTYAATLPADVPPGTAVYASFNHFDQQLKSFLDAAANKPGFTDQRAQIEAFLGLSLDRDVLPLFAHEGALAVYPAGKRPAAALILQEDDPGKAVHLVDRLVSRLNAFVHLGRVKTFSVGGVHGHELPLEKRFSLVWAGFDGRFVLTSSKSGLEQLVPNFGGRSLANDPAFRSAEAAARMPGQTTGFAYLDAGKGLPLLQELSGKKLPPAVSANVAPLGPLVFWSSPDAGRVRLSGFVGIQ